jgi:hypothetical protein
MFLIVIGKKKEKKKGKGYPIINGYGSQQFAVSFTLLRLTGTTFVFELLL